MTIYGRTYVLNRFDVKMLNVDDFVHASNMRF